MVLNLCTFLRKKDNRFDSAAEFYFVIHSNHVLKTTCSEKPSVIKDSIVPMTDLQNQFTWPLAFKTTFWSPPPSPWGGL